MAHITLPKGLPGITGPMAQYPETERHLSGLAEALLRGPSSITPAERELIATYVSSETNVIFVLNRTPQQLASFTNQIRRLSIAFWIT